MRLHTPERGSLLVTTLIIMMFLSVVILSLMFLGGMNMQRASSRITLLQAQYSAETGADIGLSLLNSAGAFTYGVYSPEKTILTNATMYRATYQMKIDDDPGGDPNIKVITSVGKVYTPSNSAQAKYTRAVRVTAKRSSQTSAASIISRNVLHIASSVKTVLARDLLVNEYIVMDKNTNQLSAETLTVGGKRSDANNCSISGSGKLVKPSSFTNPGQTTTILNLAYDNCITPPGHMSNADFTVNENRTDIEKVQSTYIPWGYVMNSSYANSPSGCSDWTTGTFPRSIPSTGNTKKTHYPNTLSGVSTGCGTNGTLNLGNGSYTIRDHIHVRANICAPNSPCAPTFSNPDNDIKFIFVEGSLSFSAVKTTGIGSIVFVVYGSDPPELSGACPIGGAAYLGPTNSDNVNAPNLYLIAVNGGFCAEKTKFGNAIKSLGGVSGKNVYIATNSGTPFDLRFNPEFPVEQIPINLSWKAATYQRIQPDI